MKQTNIYTSKQTTGEIIIQRFARPFSGYTKNGWGERWGSGRLGTSGFHYFYYRSVSAKRGAKTLIFPLTTSVCWFIIIFRILGISWHFFFFSLSVQFFNCSVFLFLFHSLMSRNFFFWLGLSDSVHCCRFEDDNDNDKLKGFECFKLVRR